jgi:hypothetical protein
MGGVQVWPPTGVRAREDALERHQAEPRQQVEGLAAPDQRGQVVGEPEVVFVNALATRVSVGSASCRT